MICVWEQTCGSIVFLLTPVQIRIEIKDATWLLEDLCSSDQTNVLLYHFTSPYLFPTTRTLYTFISPFSFHPLRSCKWMHCHLSFRTLADVSHITITLSPHVRKAGVSVVSAQRWEQSSLGSIGPVDGSDCRAGRGPLLGNDHFSGSN